MKPKTAFAALCLLALSPPVSADIFELKDGTRLEGAILRDAGDSYVLEVHVTKSIKDERKILKADVTKIIRDEPDLKAFESLSKLVPAPDLLTSDDYEMNIAALNKFLKTYPTSNKVKTAKAMIETLKSEAAQVAAGGIKLNGKIVPPAEYAANAYDLDARVQEAKIRTLVSENQFLPALRRFTDFDRDFSKTLSYSSLLTLIKQVIQSHTAEAEQSLLTLDARIKERAVGIQRMTREDRTVTEAAIADQNTEIEALYKSEKAAKQSWVTTSPFHKASLEDTVKFGKAELARLATVQTVLGVDAGKSYREVWTAIQNSGNAATISAAIAGAKTAAVPARYLAPLEAKAKGIK
ncbi:hypothetical protein HQ447_20720 [bacterium]|nr:hypothetical protein [bacterium]